MKEKISPRVDLDNFFFLIDGQINASLNGKEFRIYYPRDILFISYRQKGVGGFLIK